MLANTKSMANWILVLHTLFYLSIHRDAKLAVLHCQVWAFSLNKKKVIYLFLAAKQTIAKACRKPPVSFPEVKNHMTTLIFNKKVSGVFNDSYSKFLNIWELWLKYTLPLVSLDQL